MSKSLLKPSSAWFSRPKHLRNNFENSTINLPQICTEKNETISPEDEYYIRKYFPVTLGHLLSDLHFTRAEAIINGTADFDANLRLKFEKHLEESHPIISGSTSDSEESSETDNASDLEQRIENDLSPDNNTKKPFKRLQLQLPKVNYPQESMQFLLPVTELNNRRSVSPVLTKSFCTGCINKSAIPPNIPIYGKLYKKSRTHHQKNFKELVKHDFLPALERQFSFSWSEYDSAENNMCNNCKNWDLKDTKNYSHEKLISLPEETTADNLSTSRTGDLNSARKFPRMSSSDRISRNADQNSVRKTKSSFPVLRSRQKTPHQFGDQIHEGLPPSPYMVELIRLRKEKLQIEERLLLRRRQYLEIERLRSPVQNWYERKDPSFHEEARQNNFYLKNERVIPLIREKRRLLLETTKI